MPDILDLDYETKSEVDLPVAGLDLYARHPSTEVILASWSINGAPPALWDIRHGQPFPALLRDALTDPSVEKWAFNAAFERVVTRDVLRLPTPIKGWRCVMALAYLQSFTGGLGDVTAQMGLPADQQKDKDGRRLVKQFSMPQRVTAKQPHLWRDWRTDPENWVLFGEYCRQDVVAEMGIKHHLLRYPVPPDEWELYELDQKINDRGMPIDRLFVEQAIIMSDRRRAQLLQQMQALTKLDNPNSTAQLLPWVKERGYWFDDLRKETVAKVITEDKEMRHPRLTDECRAALALRKHAARMSVTKYDAILRSISDDGRIRHVFQFAGASRTARWAGRRFQPHNLGRTPKMFEDEEWLWATTDAIRSGDADAVELLAGEPMETLAGLVRSSVSAPEDEELRVCDLASIETAKIAWLAKCVRLLKVFADGLDPYKDFACVLYNKVYALITKDERNKSKAPVLGGVYRLSGGELRNGKWTGLKGYAENMGIALTREESHRAVRTLRTSYREIPALWYALEEAVVACLQTNEPQTVNDLITFERRKPYLAIRLPSGRRMYYHQPRLQTMWFAKDPETGTVDALGGEGEATAEERRREGWTVYSKLSLTYMGRVQNGSGWYRLPTHGGKLVENIVQAAARDVLKVGLLRADADGFDIVGHVHDEIITQAPIGDTYHTVERLRELMSAPIDWAPGLPLGAAGWSGPVYRKD